MSRRLKSLLLTLVLLLPLSALAATDSITANAVAVTDSGTVDAVAATYARRCSGCHTIGGGKLSGPDLLGTLTWTQPDIQKKIKDMEKNAGPISDADVSALARLLADREAKARVQKAGEILLAGMFKSLEPASAEAGKRLFTGETQLANRGTACIACHTVDRWGGSLARDLTRVAERMGTNALISAIRNSDFKVMRTLFKDRPVTAQEAVHLAKYFEHIKDGNAAAAGKYSGYVGLAGIGGGVLFFGFLPFLFRRRYGSARGKLGALTRQRKDK